VIVVLGTAPLRAERQAAIDDAAHTMQAATLAEPGCLLYRFAVALDDPHQLVLHEIWADDASLRAHFETPHFAAFRRLLRQASSSPTHFTCYGIARSSPLFASPSPEGEQGRSPSL
jgi:quinol monooxygenase YgiN